MTSNSITITKMASPASRTIVWLNRLRRDRRGNVAIAVAALMPVIVGFGGMALDTIQWIEMKQRIQRAADAAAIAASLTTIRGGNIDESVDRSLDLVRAGLPSITVASEVAPDGHEKDPHAVTVTVTAVAPMTFTSMFMKEPFAITADATATMVETSDFCMLALRAGYGPGIVIERSSDIDIDCGVATNSRDRKAVLGDNSSKISVRKLLAQGGFALDLDFEGRARRDALMQRDPIADVDAPKVPTTGCPNLTINADGAGGRALEPGCYGNLVINGHAELHAGTYILNRGSIIFGPNASVSCHKCTFFLTSDDAAVRKGSIGSVKIHPKAVVKLSAPDDGPYRGLLMYQSRSAGNGSNLLSGNSRSKYEGLVYFPKQDLFIDGLSGSAFSCSRFVGRRFVLNGDIHVAKGCRNDDGKMTVRAAEVRLVG